MPVFGPLFFWSAKDYRALHEKLDTILQQGKTIMTDLTGINKQIDDLKAQVEADSSVEQSAVTLIQGATAMIAELQKEVADLSAGTVTQAEIDALAAKVGAQSQALKSSSDALAAAVVANTPAAPPAPAPAPTEEQLKDA